MNNTINREAMKATKKTQTEEETPAARTADAKRKERARIQAKEWYSKNRDKAKAAALRRYHANKERAAERRQVWKTANRDRVNEYKREYNKRHPDKWRAEQKRYAIKYPERLKEKSRDYYRRHADEICAYQSAYQKEQVGKLADRYIRQLLVKGTNLSRADIPQDLIAVKKRHLKIQRQLNQITP